jgi:uncharacterized protein
MKVVLDTNVLVSALLNPAGTPASVLNLIVRQRVTLLVDNRILFEYQDVLRRGRFEFPADAANALLEFIESESEYINAEPVKQSLSDPDDVPFYEVAVTGEADALVTGNSKHYPKRALIQSPREFLNTYTEDNRKTQDSGAT